VPIVASSAIPISVFSMTVLSSDSREQTYDTAKLHRQVPAPMDLNLNNSTIMSGFLFLDEANMATPLEDGNLDFVEVIGKSVYAHLLF
jgi:hypothetical protein